MSTRANGLINPTTRFLAPNGVEVPAVDAAQMREVDRIAMEETGPNLFQMMENAGRNLARLAFDVLGDRWRDATVLVLAGSGGNGGGGICAARHLANRNARVTLCLADSSKLEGVPAFQRTILKSTSAREIAFDRIQDEHPDLILDALIGYGLQSAPSGHVADLIDWTTSSAAHVLALDIPSGVDATSGATPGVFVNARWTLTLALPKKGLRPQVAGELYLADIGIPPAVYQRIGIQYVPPFGREFYVPLHFR
jgi:NAD(P)H-hydrate epimerase